MKEYREFHQREVEPEVEPGTVQFEPTAEGASTLRAVAVAALLGALVWVILLIFFLK